MEQKEKIILLLCLILPFAVQADPPAIRTPAPVIYLADNLDEQDKLGWCIDTKGRGFSEFLHVHSCKPHGGDVQFLYDQKLGQIRSAEFSGKCVTLTSNGLSNSFRLLDCEVSSTNQKFIFDSHDGEFHPRDKSDLCIVAGERSRTAGPFMSRGLHLEPCKTTDEKLKNWVIKGR